MKPTRSSKLLRRFGLAAGLLPLLTSALTAAPFVYNSGDLVLGFRKSGSPDLVVDLGSAANFDAVPAGTSIAVTNIPSGQLSLAYASLNSVRWAVFGSQRVPGGAYPLQTIWASAPRAVTSVQSAPWLRQGSFAQGGPASQIASVGVNASTYSGAVPAGPTNAATGVIIPTANPNAYTPLIEDANNSALGDFAGTFQGNVENITPADFTSAEPLSRIDLYELIPGTTAGGTVNVPGKLVGHFDFTPGGAVSFTAGADALPTITSQPVSVSTNAGTSATLSVAVTGTGPYSYQWNLNGSPISGATGSSLALADLASTNAGSYTVTISNSVGSTNSSTVQLAVSSPPLVNHSSDLYLALRKSGSPDLVVNIGQASIYDSLPLGTTITVTNLLDGQLNTAYASLDNLRWSVSGATRAPGGADPLQTIWASDPRTVTTTPALPWKRQGSFAQAGPASQIAEVGVDAATYSAAHSASISNTLTGVIIPANDPNAYTPLVADPDNSSLGDFAGTFQGNAENVTPADFDSAEPLSRSDVYEIIPASGAAVNTPAKLIGHFDFTPNGTVTFTAEALPAITVQPVSTTNNAGNTATFSVTATGTGPLTYQWEQNGSAISGATTSTLTLNSVADANAGSYTVLVSNYLGSVTSSTAALTVIDPPQISVQPVSVTTNLNSNVAFSVTATGTSPLNYRWSLNGVNLNDSGNVIGSVTSLLGLAHVGSTNVGNYEVVVSNSGGSVTSSVAALFLNGGPVISKQPVSATVAQSATVHTPFSVTASSTPASTLHYQWYFNSTPVAGATTATYSPLNSLANSGAYYVTISNIDGIATSSTADLTVIATPSVSGLVNVTNATGTTVTFTAVTNGTPATITWYHGTSILPANLIADATGPTYTFTVSDASAGEYWIEVTPVAGTAVNTHATLTVLDPPTFTLGLTNSFVNQGAAATLYAKASANANSPVTFYWQFAPLGGSYNSTFAHTNGPLPATVAAPALAQFPGILGSTNTQGSYLVIASNVVAQVTNGPITLAVNYKPVITSSLVPPLAGFGRNVGSNYTWTVGATGITQTATSGGPLPLAYYWTINNVKSTTGASPNAPVVITNTANGVYLASVTVSNIAGIATYGTNFVINTPVKVSLQIPATAKIEVGKTYKYLTSALGTGSTTPGAIGFQWSFNGNPISGATQSTYTVGDNLGGYIGATLNDNGTYSVTVSNVAGFATSTNSTFTAYADTNKPSIVIAAPTTPTTTVTANSFAVTGTSADDAQVTNVVLTLNGTNDIPTAPGTPLIWKTWSANLNGLLVPGTNTIVAQSVDFSGNITAVSAANTKKFVFLVTNSVPLTLTGLAGNVGGTAITNLGTTFLSAPTATNLQLAIGLQYTLLATNAGSGLVFSNWLVFPSGTAGTGTASVTNLSHSFSFFVTTNGLGAPLAIEGDFAPTPFPTNSIAGIYNGLFSDPVNGVQLPSAGFVSLSVDTNGVITPSFYNLNGLLAAPSPKPYFNVLGEVQFTIVRALPLHNLTVNLGIDLTGASQTVTGTVSDVSGAWPADLTADRAVYLQTLDTNAGKYTFVLPGQTDPTLGPVGNTYAEIGVNTNGAFTIAGKLGDGIGLPTEQYPGTIYASADGTIPVYIRTVHTTPDGAIIGWLNVTNDAGVLNSSNLTATLVWEQQANAKAFYSAGFTNTYSTASDPTNFYSSEYVPPTAGHPIAAFGSTVAVTISGGDQTSTITQDFTFNHTTDVATQVLPNTDTVKLSLVPTTAGFSGSFVDPNTSLTVPFGGAVLQDANNPFNPFGVIGLGVFNSPSGPGTVQIQ